jgi:transposase
VIEFDTFCRIKHLAAKERLNTAQIARELKLGWRTVAYWVEKECFEQRVAQSRPSVLDPYKDYLQRLLEKHSYSAAQLLVLLREQGYGGGYTILKDYVRKVRPPRRKAYLTLSFAPGECAQVDWGSFGTVACGRTRRKLSFFVMVLCHSRLMYVEFTVLQTMEHFLGCHQNAFEFFGAVPQAVMVDNLKSAVLQHLVGEVPVFNSRYFDFSRYYGFEIRACNVGKGNEKGRVENGVGYVKKNFLSGLDIPDFSALGPAGCRWLAEVANVRIHGETRQRPVDLFAIEKPSLHPLPREPYDIGKVMPVRASSTFRVRLDTNRYSVPAEYAGAQLTLKAYPDRLCIYAGENLVARHVRSYDRHGDFEHPDHPKALLAERRRARQQKLYACFLTLSGKAEEYYRRLAERRLNPSHHVQKIVALREIYGTAAVGRAIEDAFTLEAFSSEYIANICEQRLRVREAPGALHLTRKSDLLDLEIPEPDLSVYDKLEERIYGQGKIS